MLDKLPLAPLYKVLFNLELHDCAKLCVNKRLSREIINILKSLMYYKDFSIHSARPLLKSAATYLTDIFSNCFYEGYLPIDIIVSLSKNGYKDILKYCANLYNNRKMSIYGFTHFINRVLKEYDKAGFLIDIPIINNRLRELFDKREIDAISIVNTKENFYYILDLLCEVCDIAQTGTKYETMYRCLKDHINDYWTDEKLYQKQLKSARYYILEAYSNLDYNLLDDLLLFVYTLNEHIETNNTFVTILDELDIGVIKYLVNNHEHKLGDYEPYYLIYTRRIEVVSFFLSKGYLIDNDSWEWDHSPLEIAAYEHGIEVAKYLLENGFNVNSTYWGCDYNIGIDCIIASYDKRDDNIAVALCKEVCKYPINIYCYSERFSVIEHFAYYYPDDALDFLIEALKIEDPIGLALQLHKNRPERKGKGDFTDKDCEKYLNYAISYFNQKAMKN